MVNKCRHISCIVQPKEREKIFSLLMKSLAPSQGSLKMTSCRFGIFSTPLSVSVVPLLCVLVSQNDWLPFPPYLCDVIYERSYALLADKPNLQQAFDIP